MNKEGPSPEQHDPAPAGDTGGPDEDQHGLSYSMLVWNQFKKQWENTWALGVMIFFFLIALFAPLLSSNLPLYWSTEEGTEFPWFRRLVTSETIDYFYNLSMISVVGVAVFGLLFWFLLHKKKKLAPVAYAVVGFFSLYLLYLNLYTFLLVGALLLSLGLWKLLETEDWPRSNRVYWGFGTLLLYLGAMLVTFSNFIIIPYGKRYSVYKQVYDGHTVYLEDGSDLSGDVIEREDYISIRLVESDQTREIQKENIRKIEKNSNQITALFPPFIYGHREQQLGSKLLYPGSYPDPPTALKDKIVSQNEDLQELSRKGRESELMEKLKQSEAFMEYVRSHPHTMGMFYLGTDTNGRDILARTLFGARVSLAVGFVATSIALFIGVILGAIAGYFGGTIDIIISRVLEIFMMFPRIMLIVALVSFVENREMLIFYIMIILGLTRWPGVCRLIRGTSLQKREEDYTMAARALGAGNMRVVFKHVLPNAVSPLFVNAPFAIAGGIILEGGLALIGFGAQNYPSWGNILNQALPRLTTYPYLIVVPTVAIFFAVTSFNLIGAGFRDAIDPKMKVSGGR